jgi:hypothetical protein
VLDVICEECSQEWGEYPQPVGITNQGGEWRVNFKNHADDQNPSTIVMGDHRKLMVNGRHHFSNDFYLPDGMTAQELVDYAYYRCGMTPTTPPQDKTAIASLNCSPEHEDDPVQSSINNMVAKFADGIDQAQSHEQLTNAYRQRFANIVNNVRVFADQCPVLIKSVEGLSKTTSHFRLIKMESFDDAVEAYNSNAHRFGCFAFRSYEQTEQKAKEFRAAGGHAVVIEGFQHSYERVCQQHHCKPLSLCTLSDGSLHTALAQIKTVQPGVYAALETHRQQMWQDARFDAGLTTLFMAHTTVMTWLHSQKTRLWCHPDFDPNRGSNEHLRDTFHLQRVVFDELELDELLHILPASTYDVIRRAKDQFTNWRALPQPRRFALFKNLDQNSVKDFYQFDELMRLDLSRLEEFRVDYDAIPFGNDNSPSGIYRQRHGQAFYIGVKDWFLKAGIHWTFLTTEDLMTQVVATIYARQECDHLVQVRLDDFPGLYPISVPLHIDPHAKADRGDIDHISALAKTITDADPLATIICNGVKGDDGRVLSFQKAKGCNGLNERNIYVILTLLSPDHYARLNVVGQWLNNPNIIATYYADQINQAVGRNRGFRQSMNRETKAVVISSKKLNRTVLSKFEANRIRLHECREPLP